MELSLFAAAYLVFVFSLVAHEGAHAIVAKWGGDWTAYNRGQASLNPMPHMKREPAGLVVIPILTYLSGGFMMGWASAPYHVEWSRRYPGRAALMAAAGPAANILLVLLSSSVVVWMVNQHGWSLSSGGWDTLVVNELGEYDLWTRTLEYVLDAEPLVSALQLDPSTTAGWLRDDERYLAVRTETEMADCYPRPACCWDRDSGCLAWVWKTVATSARA